LVRRADEDKERGFGNLDVQIDPDAVQLWATMSDGDARRALMGLEVAVLSQIADRSHGQVGRVTNESPRDTGYQPVQGAPSIQINLNIAEQSMQRKAIVYDGTGDEHYDAASALIKSMRGGDPDASVYWVARMLEAGEDPRFVARRIAILASEDIGNADPQAIQVAAAAYNIVERIGMPEAQITLSQAAIYMATAPKSNASYMAISKAMHDVREGRTIPVPIHLRDTHYRGSSRLGHGKDYQYPHDFEAGVVDQEYLGVDVIYYNPTDRGYEADIKRRLDEWRKRIQLSDKQLSDRQSADLNQQENGNENAGTD
jgi:putative ATPase